MPCPHLSAVKERLRHRQGMGMRYGDYGRIWLGFQRVSQDIGPHWSLFCLVFICRGIGMASTDVQQELEVRCCNFSFKGSCNV